MPTWAISAARRSGISWLTLVYPCLTLNYLGQGALLLSNPEAVQNPFFYMAPEWARLPLVGIATLATIIASQAVISGAFSVTRQAVQLGFLPRLSILHTSAKAAGQIYIPIVNWTLLVLVVLLVLGFGESTKLASAYGIAVTGTMFITTCMLAVVLFRVWKWNPILAGAGDRHVLHRRRRLFRVEPDQDRRWRLVPAAGRGGGVHRPDHLGDRPAAAARAAGARARFRCPVFIKSTAGSLHRVRGTSVFMASSAEDHPVGAAAQHQAQPGAARAGGDPDRADRGSAAFPAGEAGRSQRGRRRLQPRRPALWLHGRDRCAGRPGSESNAAGGPFNMMTTSFFLGRQKLIASKRPGMALWREQLFAWMNKNSESAMEFFRLADQPRGRARQPAGDLSDAGFGRLG